MIAVCRRFLELAIKPTDSMSSPAMRPGVSVFVLSRHAFIIARIVHTHEHFGAVGIVILSLGSVNATTIRIAEWRMRKLAKPASRVKCRQDRRPVVACLARLDHK